jgi:hypothetical protein
MRVIRGLPHTEKIERGQSALRPDVARIRSKLVPPRGGIRVAECRTTFEIMLSHDES